MTLKAIAISIALIGASVPIGSSAQTTNPAVTQLMQSYNLSRDEAQLRVDLQNEILVLSERLNADNDPAYADMYIQQEPTFKIIVLFADKSDRKAFLDSVNPKLKRYVQLKNAKKSRGVAVRELDALNGSIAALNVPFTSKYDLASEQFVINVADDATAARVNAALPDTRKIETVVRVAALPVIQAAPTGIVAGDRLVGGDGIRIGASGSGAADCTLAYAVGYTLGGIVKKGILTAGHCSNTMRAFVNGHDIILSGPDLEKQEKPADGLSDKYDFQIFDATGTTVDNRIKFANKNSIPEFPASGELRITAITSFLNQKAGMIVCKSGANSGITCGEITNGNLTWDGAAGWIEVSKTKQAVISVGGDSGAPWFIYPGTATNITGVGIHTAGNSVSGPTGIAIYMPIDYIDDQNSTVNTIKQ